MGADVFTMGADLGSTASKCLILKNGTEIVGSAAVSAGAGTSGPERAVAAALADAKLSRSDVLRVTATGYGRSSFEGADDTVSELSCHAIGAHALFPEARTVVDIGGQDAKVLHLDENGRLQNFVMNDKCAAGTGRFLDVMARVLELEVSELGARDALAQEAVPISSTCTVFAESEVISQLARKADINALVRGIHDSVAVRTASLIRRLGLTEPLVMTGGVAQNGGVVRALAQALVMTGGVAQNGGVVRALAQALGVQVRVSPLCQLNGAYGAAIHAWKKAKE